MAWLRKVAQHGVVLFLLNTAIGWFLDRDKGGRLACLLEKVRHCRIIEAMHTVSETEIFQKYAEAVWSEAERTEFINWIAANPLAGDVVPGSNSCRKVRWSRAGMGKRGGVRVIYFNEFEGRIWLLIVYAKAKYDNLPAEFLAQLKDEVEHG